MARGRVPRFYAARNRNGQTSHRDASFWELVGDFREVGIAAPRERVWSALQRCTATSVRIPEGSPIARLFGTRAHTAATTHILRSVRRLSLAPA
jgi:hypothetical protein